MAYFKQKLSNDIINDAISTYETYYIQRYGVLTHVDYLKREIVSVATLKSWDMENIGWHRLQPTPELAYPLSDRPRGDHDIESVNYALSIFDDRILDKLNPLIVFDINGKRLFLDGVHRLCAKSEINQYWFYCFSSMSMTENSNPN